MSKNYSQGSGWGLGRLFNALGLLTALILIIGMLDKAGVRISLQERDRDESSTFYSASMDDATAENNNSDVIVVSPNGSTSDEADNWEPVSGKGGSKAGRSARQPSSVDDWIGRFSSSAVQQAIRQGIPAGIALAVGISKLEEGVHIDSWQAFMEEIILPLARVKDNATDSERRSYFKYTANSGRWADGLGRNANFSATVLKRNIDRYRLHDYDRAVTEKLANGDVVDLETERKARAVADEVATTIRNRKTAEPDRERRATNVEASEKASEWDNYYDESVGHEVAKEIARKKLKSGQYISEEDMSQLVDETNTETSKVLKNKLSFLGRKINRGHPDAEKMLDITDPKNAQAREELFQRKLEEKRWEKKD